MKILMLAPEPFFQPRGTPISVYQRLCGLSQLGYEVDLVTYHLGSTVSIPGITLHRTPSVPIIREVRPGPSWQKLLLDSLLFCKAISLLLKNSYDVIHTHEEAAYFAAFFARTFNSRHIYDMHSSLPRQLNNFNLWKSPVLTKICELLEGWTIKRSDTVITIATDLEQHVRSVAGAARCVLIENLPVQTTVAERRKGSVEELRARLGLTDRLPIVYTGNLQHYQGIDLLIDSADAVVARHPEACFILAGGRPAEIKRWERVVVERSLAGFVRFVGEIPIDELPNYLELAEILVSPRTEGMSVPLKIYSYLLAGKAIVATNIPAHTLVLGQETAVLVEPTKLALAEGITRLAGDANLRQQLGAHARDTANQKYDAESYLAKLKRAYGPFQDAAPPLEGAAGAVVH